MCHNPCVWHKCPQVKLTNEELCQRIVPNNKLQNKIQIRESKSTWEQSNVTWKQLCQCHLRIIVPASLGNNRASLTWEQSCQFYVSTFAPVSLRNNCASLT